MNKEKIISIVLKIISVLILLYGMWIFYDWRLWKNMRTDFGNILQIFLPISVLGFSGILYGIATLLNKDK